MQFKNLTISEELQLVRTEPLVALINAEESGYDIVSSFIYSLNNIDWKTLCTYCVPSSLLGAENIMMVEGNMVSGIIFVSYGGETGR